MNKETKRHLGNISRSVGHDVTNRYNYIISESDLIDAWVKLHNDLGYPLMTDSKYHRAIIYNKEGLEKQIESMINSVIAENMQELADIVAADINAQLNSLTQVANGQLMRTSGHNSNMGALIGKAIGNGLVKSFNDFLDDIIDYDDDYKRR